MRQKRKNFPTESTAAEKKQNWHPAKRVRGKNDAAFGGKTELTRKQTELNTAKEQLSKKETELNIAKEQLSAAREERGQQESRNRCRTHTV